MNDIDRLERLSAIADARLGVAEELGWVIALLLAVVVHQRFDSWLWSIAAFIGSYVLVVMVFRKESDRAEDEYYRAAGLGKYVKPRVSTD